MLEVARLPLGRTPTREPPDVRHALFAIDNDGARRHPEHDDIHDVAAQARGDRRARADPRDLAVDVARRRAAPVRRAGLQPRCLEEALLRETKAYDLLPSAIAMTCFLDDLTPPWRCRFEGIQLGSQSGRSMEVTEEFRPTIRGAAGHQAGHLRPSG